MLLINPHRPPKHSMAWNVAILWFFLLLLTSCSSKNTVKKSSLIVPKGWYLSMNNTTVDFIKAKENKTTYTLFLDRQNNSPQAEHYLRIAESLFPIKEKLLNKDAAKTENWYFDRIWWSETYKENPIPYALTADTINHYLTRYQDLKRNLKDRKYQSEWKGSNLNRIELFYTAKVNQEGSFSLDGQSVPKIRVTLKMKWYEYCGQPCGWGFEKNREIVFAGKSRVIEIKGDGPTTKWISDSKTPYGPNQWIKF